MTFSTPPQSFWAHEECLPIIRWAGHTNLSQVRLETSGVAGHEFTKAPGMMKPKTRFSLAQGDEIQHLNMRFFNAESFATEKRRFGPKMSNALDCHDSRHLYKPSAGSCVHRPGHTKDEGWNYRLAVPHLKLQMKLVDLLWCPLEDRALGKNASD